jgi:pimeloyl-ACP methyl ester carboxylesterase
MNEIPVLFGFESALVGVVCKPAVTIVPGVACLLLNAGVVPRIGPHRINVKLARVLADSGIVTLRFDLGGLGDSRKADAPSDFQQRAVLDVRAAMDYLESHHGLHRFIVIGNCSGAVHAYWTALADQRVIGIQMFDGFCYPSRWSRLVRHWKRFRADSWNEAVVAVGRRLAKFLRFLCTNDIFSSIESKAQLGRDEYCKGMQALVDRGVSVCLVFSGGIIDDYSYARQFRDTFADQPFVDKVHCHFLPEIDHTMLALEAQRRFIELTRDWLFSGARLAPSNTPAVAMRQQSSVQTVLRSDGTV